MPIKWRMPLVAALAAGHLFSPLPASACTKSRFIAFQFAPQAHFIGVATADTLFAGAGDVKYEIAQGHSGPAVDRPIYGQLVAIERMGGPAASRLRRPLKNVVLVPWDYAADCTPTPWSRSARWAEPGARGLFVAMLRDSANWTAGLPTFDVFSPEMYPYPQRAARMMRRPSITPDSLLDIEQVFALASTLPDFALAHDSGDVAAEPLFAWARANPELARRFPASGVLHAVRYAVVQSRLHHINPPVVGTYRFTVTFDALERTYYARTYPTPNSAFTLVDQSPPADPTFVARPAGYYMIVAGSLVRDSLPRDCGRGRRPDKEGYIAVLDDPPTMTSRGREWRGKIEMDLITRVFPEDSAIRHFARAEFEQFSRRRRGNVPTQTPALFIERLDGTLHVEQEIVLDDGRRMRIHGTRLSLESVVCTW